MLGGEILRVTRRTRVLEERIMPRLQRQIRAIAQYLGEREREAHYRLKKFKQDREAGRTGGRAPFGQGPCISGTSPVLANQPASRRRDSNSCMSRGPSAMT